MKKKQKVSINQIRQYLKAYHINEEKLFQKENREELEKIFSQFTGMTQTKTGMNIQSEADDGEIVQTELDTTPTNLSDFRNLEEFTQFVNEQIDKYNKVIEISNQAEPILNTYPKEKQAYVYDLHQAAKAELQKINQIRKQRELTIADINADAIETLTKFNIVTQVIKEQCEERLVELRRLDSHQEPER